MGPNSFRSPYPSSLFLLTILCYVHPHPQQKAKMSFKPTLRRDEWRGWRGRRVTGTINSVRHIYSPPLLLLWLSVCVMWLVFWLFLDTTKTGYHHHHPATPQPPSHRPFNHMCVANTGTLMTLWQMLLDWKEPADEGFTSKLSRRGGGQSSRPCLSSSFQGVSKARMPQTK